MGMKCSAAVSAAVDAVATNDIGKNNGLKGAGSAYFARLSSSRNILSPIWA
jgi:hypothetical protein